MEATELRQIAPRIPSLGPCGLKTWPFRLTPDPVLYFDSRTHSDALRGLQSFVLRKEGLALIYGDVGTGKTLLCRRFFEGLDRRAFNAGLILNPAMTEREFLAGVLRAFDVTTHSHSTMAYMLEALRSLVKMEGERGKVSVLAVDEAQLLSDDLLELLARHSDSWDEGGISLRVALFAQEELASRLVDRRMRHIRRRITVTRCLQPLSPDEIGAYLTHHLAAAGSEGAIRFDKDALKRIYQVSEGNGRIVNTLSGRCLLSLEGRSGTVTRKIVDRVVGREGIHTPESASKGRPGSFSLALLLVALGLILYGFFIVLRPAFKF